MTREALEEDGREGEKSEGTKGGNTLRRGEGEGTRSNSCAQSSSDV